MESKTGKIITEWKVVAPKTTQNFENNTKFFNNALLGRQKAGKMRAKIPRSF